MTPPLTPSAWQAVEERLAALEAKAHEPVPVVTREEFNLVLEALVILAGNPVIESMRGMMTPDGHAAFNRLDALWLQRRRGL